jgi:hypothetical protein
MALLNVRLHMGTAVGLMRHPGLVFGSSTMQCETVDGQGGEGMVHVEEGRAERVGPTPHRHVYMTKLWNIRKDGF